MSERGQQTILIDARFLAGRTTGMGRYVTHILSDLVACQPTDIAFHMLRLTTDKSSAGASQHVLGGTMAKARPQTLLQQLVIPAVLSVIQPDLYHYPSFDAPIVIGRPWIVTCADVEPLRVPHLFPHRIVWYYQVFKRRLRAADRVIAISDHTARDLVAVVGVNPDKIRVIHLGIESRFRPIREAAALDRIRAGYHLPEQYVLYVGNTMPHKNVTRLVQAFQRVLREHPQLQLILVGKEDKYRPPILKVVEDYDLNGQVRFLGQVPESDLPGIYSAASVLVLPSLYEGFGLPVVEAMACATPVVASNVASLPEIVDDCALLVDPLSVDAIANAVLQVLNNRSVAERLSIAGLERSRGFTWRRCAEEHLALYREVLQIRG